MAPLTVNGIDELKELVGQTVGPSDWREITQELIDQFAEVSGDDQWIHVDVERAKSDSPFGGTVAHGNLTLSLIDGFRKDVLQSGGFKLGVNYGWNKVRFPRAGAERREGPGERRGAHGGRGRRRLVADHPEVDGRGGGLREARLRRRVRRPSARLSAGSRPPYPR